MEERLVEHGQQGGGDVLCERIKPLSILAREDHRLTQEQPRRTAIEDGFYPRVVSA